MRIQKISMEGGPDSRVDLLARIVAWTLLIFAITLTPLISAFGDLNQGLECSEQNDEDDLFYGLCNSIDSGRNLVIIQVLILFSGSYLLFGFSRDEEENPSPASPDESDFSTHRDYGEPPF